MEYTINLKAGITTRQQTAGRMFMLKADGGQSIALKLGILGGTDEEVSDARKGFKARLSGLQRFTHFDVKAAADCSIVVIVSDNDIDLNFTEGASVSATIVNPIPVPVTNDRGSPGTPLYVSGLTYSDAPATSVTNTAAVAVNNVSTPVLAANINRKAVRFCNLGPDPVAIGGAVALIWARRCIVLDVGDTWVEERGANVAWSAICDAGKTASVTAQEVIA